VTEAAAARVATIRGAPLTGVIGRWRKDALGVLSEADATGADAIRFRLGPRWALLLRHPDLIWHVLVENQRNYEKRTRGYLKLRLVLGDGLLTSNGAHWLRQRRIAQPAFHRDRLAGLVSVFSRAAQDMVAAWQAPAERGEAIDVAQEMMRVTLRIAAETLLSADVTRDADAVGRSLTLVLGHTMGLITSLVPYHDRLPTPRNLRFREALADLDRVVLGIIAERRRASSPGADLLGMLMSARDEETGEGMTDRQLRDEVMTIFLAGHETTANALAWTLLLVSEHPEERQRLEAEVDGVAGTGPVTVGHLPALPRVEMVLKESMRLYPPVWILGRSAVKPDEVAGVRVPAGGFVFVSPWLTHRHPAYWPDPLEFRPERFTPDASRRIPHGAYLPFSAGPRLCIGNHFAMMEAQVILAAILARFRLTLCPGHPVVPQPLITLRPKHGIRMHLRPR
jgi:cytochrome P450